MISRRDILAAPAALGASGLGVADASAAQSASQGVLQAGAAGTTDSVARTGGPVLPNMRTSMGQMRQRGLNALATADPVMLLADRADSRWVEANPADCDAEQNGFAWFTDSGGRTWKLAEPIADVRFFGARGDGEQDDASAINAAIKYCRKTGAALYFPGGRTYLVKSSLDFTVATPFRWLPLLVFGDGRLSSVILGDLSEPYPVIDLTNSKRTTIRQLTVRTKPESQDTCSVLLAENIGAGVNLMRFEGCAFYNSSRSSAASVVNISADQVYFTDCEISADGPTATCAFRADGRNGLDIASKVYGKVQGHVGDLTMLAAQRCNITCAGGYTIDIESFALVSMTECYFATLPSSRTTPSMIRLKSAGRTMRPSFTNCRTEHHSKQPLGSVIQVVDKATDGEFSGNYTSTRNTALFSGPGNLIRCGTRCSVSGTLFDGVGALVSSHFSIHDGINGIGRLDPTLMVGSKNVVLQGRVGSVDEIRQKMSFCPGLIINGTAGEDGTAGVPGVDFSPRRIAFSHPSTPTNWRSRAFGPSGRVTPGTGRKAGGDNGEIACKVGVSLAPLSYIAQGAEQHVLPAMGIHFAGKLSGLENGSGSSDLSVLIGASVAQHIPLQAPAGASGELTINVKVHLFRTDVKGTVDGYVQTEISADDGSVSLKKFTQIDSFSFDATGPCEEDFTILFASLKGKSAVSMFYWTEA